MGSEQQSCAECQSRKQHKMPSLLVNAAASTVPVALVLLALYFYKFHGGLSGDPAVWGQLGDYIGGLLNPFFSFIALLALLYTIRLQSEEMRNSTAELKQSAAALKIQNDLMMKQGFETSFFNLFRSFNEMVANARAQNQGLTGKKCFAEIHRIFTIGKDSGAGDHEALRVAIHSSTYDFDSYCRVLGDLIRFVDKSAACGDREFYIGLVRSGLSRSEAYLIGIKIIGNDVSDDFFTLVHKYKLYDVAFSSNVD